MTPKTLFVFLIVLLLIAAGLMYVGPHTNDKPTVVVYTSVDEEFALPLFAEFEKRTGIAVVPRTDSESSKTTAMAERLIQMKDSPDGDVFWNSELSFTQALADKDALQKYESPNAKDIPAHLKDPQGLWTAFGYRARVIIYNTQKVKPEELPKTLEDFAKPQWKGRFTVARPLFGTTRSHLVSLALLMGEDKAFKLFRAWRDNGMVLAASNGDVRNRVADGFSDIGLTDTDDAIGAIERNKPVNFFVPDQTPELRGAFLIPNTVSMLKNCKRPDSAKKFIDFLLLPETEKWLSQQGAKQIPVRNVGADLHPALRDLKPIKVDARLVGEKIVPLGKRIDQILSGEEK